MDVNSLILPVDLEDFAEPTLIVSLQYFDMPAVKDSEEYKGAVITVI